MDAVVRPDTPGGTPPRPFAELVCAIVGHRPDAPPLWNHGHGFAWCTRCARPIVRTIVHGWRLPPRGYHVRWPAREASAPTERRPAAAPPAQRTTRKGADFMGDPLAGTVTSAFDFDDFASGSRPPATTEPSRRSAP